MSDVINAGGISDSMDGSDDAPHAVEHALAGGLRFANYLAASAEEQALANRLLLNAVIELLVSKRVVHLPELEARKKLLQESLKAEPRPTRIHLVETPEKIPRSRKGSSTAPAAMRSATACAVRSGLPTRCKTG